MNMCWNRLRVATFSSLPILGLLSFAVSVGCAPSQSASDSTTAESLEDDHAEFATVEDAMAKLSDQYATIKTAFESDSPGDAHDALHEVGHTLEHIEGMTKNNSELSEEAKESALQSVEALFEAFSSLDGTMHGGDEVDFAEINTKVQEAMANLSGSE